MNYWFEPYGHFDVARDDATTCSRSQRQLWDQCEALDPGLSRAIGCYLFCLKDGQIITPWYVGMTRARDGFRDEVFQDHKLGLYQWSRQQVGRGQPILYLFALCTETGRFSNARKADEAVIKWTEKMLIGLAYAKNPNLANKRDTKFLENTVINGLLGPRRPGRPPSHVQDLREALF
ncbi:hypothetical protein [Asticcacaulis solisilvae]|uniref:hypothetical protein n=1 Tax=Asticcacaulis solisilvae TaxID=1217274 RepID=UPI003FD7570B